MFGWALPRRPGARPVTNAFWAWFTSTASVLSSSDTSIRWPRLPVRSPARSRPSSAARMLTAANRPVATSLIATPTLTGCPPSVSGWPVIDIRPPTACATKS